MASFKELDLDWSMLPEDTTTWNLEDLRLAALLAKNFLKRNQELAEEVLNLQKILDDQQNELEYFKKQNTSLREMSNDCHSRMFELEAQVEDLIKVKDEINAESKNKTKQNNKLLENIQILNQRCEELECNLDKVASERDELIKTSLREQKEIKEDLKTYSARKSSEFGENLSYHESTEEYSPKILSQDISLDDIKNETADTNDEFIEEIKEIASELRSEKSQRMRVEQRSADLEELLSTVIQENKRLRHTINVKNELFESRFDSRKTYLKEVNTLDEVRLELCSHCWQIVKGDKIESFPQKADEYDITAEKEPRRYTSSLVVLIGENGEIIDL